MEHHQVNLRGREIPAVLGYRRTAGMVIGMATVKKTLSLDADAWAFTQQAAQRAGLSPSAWLSRTARQQAIIDNYTGSTALADAEADALADETEAAEAAAAEQ